MTLTRGLRGLLHGRSSKQTSRRPRYGLLVLIKAPQLSSNMIPSAGLLRHCDMLPSARTMPLNCTMAIGKPVVFASRCSFHCLEAILETLFAVAVNPGAHKHHQNCKQALSCLYRLSDVTQNIVNTHDSDLSLQADTLPCAVGTGDQHCQR